MGMGDCPLSSASNSPMFGGPLAFEIDGLDGAVKAGRDGRV